MSDGMKFYLPYPGFEHLDHYTPIADVAVLVNLATGLVRERGRLLRIVEVGSFTGSTAIALAPYSQYVDCIDTWKGSDDGDDRINSIFRTANVFGYFWRNVRHEKRIRPRQGRSQDFTFPTDTYFDLIFLDGDHRYEAVKADYERFWPHVSPGGIICGHDYSAFDGVTQLADELGAQHQFHVWWLVRDA